MLWVGGVAVVHLATYVQTVVCAVVSEIPFVGDVLPSGPRSVGVEVPFESVGSQIVLPSDVFGDASGWFAPRVGTSVPLSEFRSGPFDLHFGLRVDVFVYPSECPFVVVELKIALSFVDVASPSVRVGL